MPSSPALPDMVCACGDQRKEREATLDRIAATSTWEPPGDRMELFDQMLASLTMLWRGDIEIIADQWYGVRYKGSPVRDQDGIDLFIQCDRPIDGIAAIYEYVLMSGPEES